MTSEEKDTAPETAPETQENETKQPEKAAETSEKEAASKEEPAEPVEATMPPAAPPIPNIATSTAEGKVDPFAESKEQTSAIPIITKSVEEAKQALPTIKGVSDVVEEPEEETPVEETSEEEIPEAAKNAHIFALRTTANREDQVLAFVSSNAARKKLGVYSVIAPHGMRGYIFMEAVDRHEAEQAAYGVPYAKGLLPNEIQYPEIEHMLEQVKKDVNIQKNDIAEILSGPFKREKCKISRVDKAKEEVVVELLEAAVPIPITLKIDAVKVIRRDEK